MASSSFLAPKELAISALAPVEIPVPMAMIMKKTGKDKDSEAKASVEMRPPKYVSTTLYMVWKNIPTLAGIAIFLISPGSGLVVRSSLFFIK